MSAANTFAISFKVCEVTLQTQTQTLTWSEVVCFSHTWLHVFAWHAWMIFPSNLSLIWIKSTHPHWHITVTSISPSFISAYLVHSIEELQPIGVVRPAVYHRTNTYGQTHSHSHSHPQQEIKSLQFTRPACFWTVRGKRSNRSKPTQIV